ncbi:MAG: hypothetical protein KGP28_05575 [Bdellovibrionales bacterium]|nr:hypothetical protein [Bdellovibrionales bacterium]
MKKSWVVARILAVLAVVNPGLGPVPKTFGDAVTPPLGNFGFPGVDPALMQMQLIATNVQAAMLACAQKSKISRVGAFFEKTGALGDLAGLTSKDTRKDAGKNLLSSVSGTKPSGTCYDQLLKAKIDTKKVSGVKTEPSASPLISELTKSQANCLLDCPPPEEDATGCVDFFGVPNASGKYNKDQKDAGFARIALATRKVGIYRAFQNFKMNACANQEELDLRVAQELYQCQQKALSAAVSEAGLQLQNVLNQHRAAFEKMTQTNQELFQQWVDISVALGAKDPDEDPLFSMVGDKNVSNQFGGLLAIQRELNEAKGQREVDAASFKAEVEKLNLDIEANDQSLEIGRVKAAFECMNSGVTMGGAGGGGLCTRPVKDEKGAPVLANGVAVNEDYACSPLESLATTVEQSAYKTSNGVIDNQRFREEARRRKLQFERLSEAIKQSMAPSGGQGETLIPQVSDWSGLKNRFGQAIEQLSAQTGIRNLEREIKKVASFCFSEGNTWRKNQIRNSKSEYRVKKYENNKTSSELSGRLQKGLGELKKNYADAMAVLGGQAVALDTSSCTKIVPTKMLDCYKQISDNTNGLLEGTGASATVIRNAKGQPLAAPCKGIDGCVTVLNQSRKVKKGQVQEGRRIQTDFAIKARATMDQSVLSLANLLKGLQGQVASQFGVVAGLANRLGVEANASPKMVEGVEPLKAMEPTPGPPPTGPGPYQDPSDLAKVLSGKMMPGGMINFADDGMGKVVADAMMKIQENKKEVRDELKDFKDKSKEIQELLTSCLKDDSDNVGNGACEGNCELALDESKCSTNIDDVLKALQVSYAITTDVKTASENGLKALNGCKTSDPDTFLLCRNCITTKTSTYSEDKSRAEGAAKSAKPE